jgi:hypothetical protein
MMRIVYAALFVLALAAPAMARTFSAPPDAPVITLTTPDNWKVREIDYGYSAMSPGEDVFFSIEYATGDDALKKMMDDNDAWMKENKIKPVKPTVEEGKVNGIDMKHYAFDTTDDDGKTLVDFFLIPSGKSVTMLTIWGSVEQRNKHKDEIMSLLGSIKPAK